MKNFKVHDPKNPKPEAPSNKKSRNKWSTIGFVLSLLSIIGIGLAGIVGMIMGIVALTQIKHTNEQGKGLAIAAIVIGSIWGVGVGILRQLVEAGY
jgi:hypothetical protein